MNTSQRGALLHSQESEMMVLGCMLTSINSLNIAANLLREDDFYFPTHQVIFQALKYAWQNDKPADVHLIAQDLRQNNQLDDIGGVEYLTVLAQYAGTSAYIEEYTEIVKHKACLRSIEGLSRRIQLDACTSSDPEQLLTDIREELSKIEKNTLCSNSFFFRSLNYFEQNFLIDKPNNKPALLEYIDHKNQTVKSFLPKSIVAMLAGAGGVGKTHILSQLALSIATGKPFLNMFTPTSHCGDEKRGNVFFGLGENDYDDIHRLLYKAAKNLREDVDLLLDAKKRIFPFSFYGQRAMFLENKRPSRYFREFKQRLQDLPPLTLIILDPVSRLMGLDAENDNAVATDFISMLEELILELPGNPTLMFAHHLNKSSLNSGKDLNQSAARGSSALVDGVRLQWSMFCEERDKYREFKLKITKSNFTIIHEPLTLEKDSDGFIRISVHPVAPRKNNPSTRNSKEFEFLRELGAVS